MGSSTRKLGSKELRHKTCLCAHMPQGGDFAAVPELGYEEWRAVVPSLVGRYNPEGVDPNAFAGRVHVRNLLGLGADRFDHNAYRIDRTQRDVRPCRVLSRGISGRRAFDGPSE
jgi:hypothetical protein